MTINILITLTQHTHHTHYFYQKFYQNLFHLHIYFHNLLLIILNHQKQYHQGKIYLNNV